MGVYSENMRIGRYEFAELLLLKQAMEDAVNCFASTDCHAWEATYSNNADECQLCIKRKSQELNHLQALRKKAKQAIQISTTIEKCVSDAGPSNAV